MSAANVIGGGPAGLIAAETLARAGIPVTVYEHMPSAGRKFLLAGHGGLDITHSEERESFITRYGASADRIEPILTVFGPEDLRQWCADLGEETVVGPNGSVVPQAFRTTPLFRAWLERLSELGVRIETQKRWVGWAGRGRGLLVEDPDGSVHEVANDVAVFALGGASWPQLGSDGSWVDTFAERGVSVTPLRAANVGAQVSWTDEFSSQFEGVSLEQVSLTVRDSEFDPGRGDVTVTRTGVEGEPVHAIDAAIRAAIDAAGHCVVEVDLRPDHTVEQLTDRLAQRRAKESASAWLRRSIGLAPAEAALLREAGGGAVPSGAAEVAALIKTVPVAVTGMMPIDRAISTAGGIAWSEVDESLMLRRRPGTFIAGEMLDWEAPTGGYLLQASFSTGVVAARGAAAWLRADMAGGC